MCNNEGAEPSLYQVNAGTYIYDMTAAQLADLLQIVQTILDDAAGRWQPEPLGAGLCRRRV
jgi:hypothetical protein